MSILDIIGWYKSSSDVFTLRARVTQDGADFSKYTLDDTDGSWVPKAGDVFTDSALNRGRLATIVPFAIAVFNFNEEITCGFL